MRRFQTALLIAASLLLFSCARPIGGTRGAKDLVIFPPPPDTTRLQFLTSFSTSVDLIGQRNAFARFVLGESKALPIGKPYGIAVANNKIYICDVGLGGLEILDLESREFSYFFPKGRGQLKNPSNCCIDASGFLYIADPGRRQIVIFDEKQQYVNAFGESGESKPTDLALTEDRVWVTDAQNSRVNVYDKKSKTKLFSFPGEGQAEEAHLFQPVNICVAGDRVYVTDFGDFKVKQYSLEGRYLSSVGGFGNQFGQFVRPKGISVDKDGILYVVDAGFDNVQMFNRQGQLLMFFGGPWKQHGDMWLPAKVLVDYAHTERFAGFVDPAFRLKYLVFVTNQYGPDKVSVYGAVEPKK